MSAPSLQDVPAIPDPLNPNLAIAGRLSATASASSASAALLALSAAGPATAAEPPPEIEEFLDVLAGLVTCPITGYQRELLSTALTGAIDARIASLFNR